MTRVDSDSKNIDFVQFNRKNISSIRVLMRKDSVAAELFMFLTQWMDRSNCVSCSQKLLQEVLGKSRTTVYNAINNLKDAGLLMVAKQGTANVYILNPQVVWSTWNTNKKYCEFEGTILLSKEENKDIEAKLKNMRVNTVAMKH
ncbi:MAG: helix-turn-helix transcriptional regulator [Oligoflexales bacterium]|nr:helix-turn-helix transcriptional regulator [Oligoflexales bacterium]